LFETRQALLGKALPHERGRPEQDGWGTWREAALEWTGGSEMSFNQQYNRVIDSTPSGQVYSATKRNPRAPSDDTNKIKEQPEKSMSPHRLRQLGAATILLTGLGSAQTCEASPGNIVILYPSLAGTGGLYLYQCLDSGCATQTQISYVTDVPPANGVPPANTDLPGLAAVSFLKLNGKALYQYFQSNEGSWYSCKLSITADGAVDSGSTTCTGATKLAQQSSSTVSVIALGAGFWMASQSGSAPTPAPSKFNFTRTRTISFVNNTRYTAICLNSSDTFNDMPTGKCTGPGDIKVLSGKPYTIKVPSGGYNSAAWFITGYRKSGKWFNSGRDPNGNVYSLVLETTMYPSGTKCYPTSQQPLFPLSAFSGLPGGSRAIAGGNCSDYTVGVTNIDVSAVNGYNFGVTAYPSRPAVCGHSEHGSEGIPYSVFSLYSASTNPMSRLPAQNSGQSLSSICPSDQTVATQAGGAQFQGCYSACTYANLTRDPDADMICCSGDYSSYSSCTSSLDHSTLPYVSNMDSYSKNVYSWAYDDNNGDFSCDPSASFTFVITN
jgi:hypothetical protein